MTSPYRPLTRAMLTALGDLEGFAVPDWTGPALAGPVTPDGVQDVLAVAERLLYADQALIQVKDAMSRTYRLNGITATAERFMFGDEQQVEIVAGIRALVTLVYAYLRKSGLVEDFEAELPHLGGVASAIVRLVPGLFALAGVGQPPPAPPPPPPPPVPDTNYSTLPLEDMRQYSMAWTTLHDVFRLGFRRLDSLVENVIDPGKATDEFWPMLSRAALPYNLLVLRKLDQGNVERFRTGFGTAWTAECETRLAAGTLYGIDMTILAGLEARHMADGTVRFTPCTMMLLTQDADKKLRPFAVYVADPADATRSQVYLPSSPAWLYGLFAVRTSLTVYGIWLGHAYPLHVVTGAMLMTMLPSLPPGHVLLQALAPHSRSTLGFNFLLMVGWNQLAPPTSLANSGQFLALSARYAADHDFFSNDPSVALAALGLDEADFTDGASPWNLYPVVARMNELWGFVADYVGAVVNDLYVSDADVATDAALAAWMSAASATDNGNVSGLPRVQTRPVLCQVLTSLLYRIVFHGMGRLRSMSNPEPSFVPNFPPCLQSSRIPDPSEDTTAASLLREFLPRTGTVGGVLGFYNLFAFTAPTVPLVPSKGPDSDLFFEARYAKANKALVEFRKRIEGMVSELQPEWVEVGQWPMSIEF